MFRKVKWDYFIRNINCQLNLDRFNRMCCRYLDLFLYCDLIVNSDTHQGKGEGGQPTKGKGVGRGRALVQITISQEYALLSMYGS